jgi:hypothetical protein
MRYACEARASYSLNIRSFVFLSFGFWQSSGSVHIWGNWWPDLDRDGYRKPGPDELQDVKTCGIRYQVSQRER